jgi:hypothetical protein
MAGELVPFQMPEKLQSCTMDLDDPTQRLKLLAIIGGASEAGKDFLPANKAVELEIDNIVMEKVDTYEKDDGEIVKACLRATCVLRSGDLVHFTSFRVVKYLAACLAMWAGTWQGIVLRIHKSTSAGKTNYKVEYVREGDWRD